MSKSADRWMIRRAWVKKLKNTLLLLFISGFVSALGLGMAASPQEGGFTNASAQNEIDFSIARMIIEFNASANDVGVQVLLDGEPWQSVNIKNPDGRRVLDIATSRSLRKQGLTELFFESSEPSLDDVPLAEFLARFPEGEYAFTGRTVEGMAIEGVAAFTHVIPAKANVISPQEGASVDLDNVVIEWQPVTRTISGSSNIVITGYQLIVQQMEPLRTFSIDLPASVTRVKIPREFFVQRNTLHKFEILAIEEGGNQTIHEGTFVTQ